MVYSLVSINEKKNYVYKQKKKNKNKYSINPFGTIKC